MPQAYRRIDPFTILDEYGLPHFVPEQYPMGTGPSETGDMTKPSSAPGQVAQLMGPGNTNQGPGPAMPGDLQGMPPVNLVGPGGPNNPEGPVTGDEGKAEIAGTLAGVRALRANGGPDAVSGPNGIAPQTHGVPIDPYPKESKKQRAQRQALERQGLLSSDPGAFTERGGVVQSREELAMLGGGAARAQEDADNSAVLGAKEVGDVEELKDRAESIFHEKSAQEYHRLVTEEHQRSVQRWEDWRKKNEQAANSKIDPHRMWNHASGFSKAMWVISILSAGATGDPQKMQLALGVLDKEIDRDISAQEQDIKNRQEGVSKDMEGVVALDKLGRLTIDDWATERNMRYQSVLKGLDAKIKQVGNVAAERTGLLQSRAAVQQKAFELQTKFQGQIEQEGQAAVERKFQAGMQSARFAHDKEMARVDFEYGVARDAAKTQDEMSRAQSVGVDPSLGLTVIGPDGQPQRITAQGGTPAQVGENAGKIGQLAVEGNEEYGNLLTVQEELGKMSTGDVLRGGTARFKMALENIAEVRARRRGGPITADDRAAALKETTGVTIDSSVVKNGWEAVKLPGDFMDGAKQVIDANIRDLPNRVTGRVKAVRGDQPGQVQYVPQDPRGKEPGTPTNNDTLATLGQGANVADLQSPVRTPVESGTLPVRKLGSGPNAGQYTNPAMPFDWDSDVVKKAAESYLDAKGKGQESPLPPAEREHVESAINAFKGVSTKEIKKRAAAAIRGADQKGMSDEAKLEIQVEAVKASMEKWGAETQAKQGISAVKGLQELWDLSADDTEDMIKTIRTKYGVEEYE